MSLQSLVRSATADGHWVVVEGEASTLITGVGFVGLVKASRTASRSSRTRRWAACQDPFPRVNRADFPIGRGFHVRNGRTALVRGAVPWDVAEDV